MSEHVTLFEMGPRDGLQNEKVMISTADKIRLVDMLTACGIEKIEVASFVNPKVVPQMADGAEVLAGINRREGVVYSALTPNLRGFERALAAGADEVAVFASASEGFSRHNINCSIAESLERFDPVMEAARQAETPVRGYVSCVVECPYDGPTPPENLASVARKLMEMGCYEISLGDTIGAGVPETVAPMLKAVLGDIPASRLAGHFHDTRGRALDNIACSLDHGLRVFDASVGGLGGCPFAPGSKGNVASEAVVDLLHDRGFATGIDPDALRETAAFAKTLRSGE
ncbi:hydroxymethylglutaryl-CoA lyase [Amaricoccus tamworthensis]|uniref:hydroxymethylglutaryl-CoA lyase n=1 Tax=Amaricoccus tamworthensis TaxID=57002 RepID=UPI003C7ED41B